MAPPSGPADRDPAQGQAPQPTVGTWLADHLFPDIRTLPGRQKVIAAVVVVLLAIVGAVTALMWDVQSESLTADTRAEIEDAAADALDQKRTPLVARTEYDFRAPLFGRIVR